jgi:thiol:disulfide interchange protein
MIKFKSLRSLTSRVFAVMSIMAFFTFTTSAQSSNSSGKLEWLVNLDEAYAQHEKTGKPILANFTGSDWCGWCKKLTKSVFSKPDFKTWADENVILLELDFPRRKKLPEDLRKQNQGLQQAFKVRGYPTIWVFDLGKDENGQYSISALGKTGYTKTVEEFTSGVDQMIARRQNSGE